MNITSYLWAFLLITATLGISLQFSLKSCRKMLFFTQAFEKITKEQLPKKEKQQHHQEKDGYQLTTHFRP